MCFQRDSAKEVGLSVAGPRPQRSSSGKDGELSKKGWDDNLDVGDSPLPLAWPLYVEHFSSQRFSPLC